MATDVNDLAEMIGSTLGRFAREASHVVTSDGHRGPLDIARGNGALSGPRKVAAGIALGAAAPVAARGVGRMAKRAVLGRTGASSGKGVAQKAVGGIKGTVGDAVEKKVDQVGGAPGMAKEAAKQMIPGVGGGGGGKAKGKQGTPGVGKGRRMPVQQEVDIGVPVEVAYNQWTQFEEWPQFMHRLDQITQEDDCTISFRTKVWGMSKEFVAQIVEQRPDERIQWNVTEGVRHTGVVTFHELGPRLTRVLVTLDVEPGSLIEKAARGMRHVKRAVRADLHRFKAFVEMQEVETGAWRGRIHDGEVVEQHPDDYDSQREYADFDDIHDREHSHEPREAAASAQPATSRSSSSRSGSGGGRAKGAGGGARGRAKAAGGGRAKAASGGSRAKAAASRGKAGAHGGRSRPRTSARSSGGKSSSSRKRGGSS